MILNNENNISSELNIPKKDIIFIINLFEENKNNKKFATKIPLLQCDEDFLKFILSKWFIGKNFDDIVNKKIDIVKNHGDKIDFKRCAKEYKKCINQLGNKIFKLPSGRYLAHF